MTSRFRRTVAALGVAAAAITGAAFSTAAPAGAAESSQVSVVHGIPGVPVDVYVNGTKTLPSFQPNAVAGPLTLAAGSYDIALTKPGDPVTSPVLENKAVAVPGAKNISLVAHLDASGKPTLTAFVNDTSPIPAGTTRLVVRHTAAAPAVDVRAGGKPVFTNLTNPNEVTADLPAGTVSADVVLAGTTTVAIGPEDLSLAAGAETIVYAVGSAQDRTLGLVAQTMSGLGSAPGGMPAGSGGEAADGVTGAWYALAGLGGLLLLSGAGMLLRPRRAVAPR